MREFLKSLWRALCSFKSKRYTRYPLATPHKPEDIAQWPEVAAEAISKGSPKAKRLPPLASAEARAAHEQEARDRRYRAASEAGYTFIDRGVSRAQGLLQFNSIVFAVLALLITSGIAGHPLFKVLGIGAIVLLALSTLTSLMCLWIQWYPPEVALDIERQSALTWEIWMHRALLFNCALLLAIPAFCVLVGLMIWLAVTVHPDQSALVIHLLPS